jgi:hypothetical protein
MYSACHQSMNSTDLCPDLVGRHGLCKRDCMSPAICLDCCFKVNRLGRFCKMVAVIQNCSGLAGHVVSHDESSFSHLGLSGQHALQVCRNVSLGFSKSLHAQQSLKCRNLACMDLFAVNNDDIQLKKLQLQVCKSVQSMPLRQVVKMKALHQTSGGIALEPNPI